MALTNSSSETVADAENVSFDPIIIAGNAAVSSISCGRNWNWHLGRMAAQTVGTLVAKVKVPASTLPDPERY